MPYRNYPKKKILVKINGQYIHHKKIDSLKEDIGDILNDYHKKFPFRTGMLKEELRTKISFDFKPKEFDIMLNMLITEEKIDAAEQYVSLKEFKIIYQGKSAQIKTELEKIYLGNDMPPQTDKVVGDNKLIDEILNSMLGTSLIKISDDIIYDAKILNNFKTMVMEYLDNNPSISVKDFKEISGLSRKYMIGLFEYFDRQKLTKRNGDFRVKY